MLSSFLFASLVLSGLASSTPNNPPPPPCVSICKAKCAEVFAESEPNPSCDAGCAIDTASLASPDDADAYCHSLVLKHGEPVFWSACTAGVRLLVACAGEPSSWGSRSYFNMANSTENVCFEMNYTDMHLSESGFAPGKCPFDDVLSTSMETFCEGHSETNIKDCKGNLTRVEVQKMGRTNSSGPPGPSESPCVLRCNSTCRTVYNGDLISGPSCTKGCEIDKRSLASPDDADQYCHDLKLKSVDWFACTAGVRLLVACTGEPPSPGKKTYFLMGRSNAGTNICYQMEYNDAHLSGEGYAPGHCPFSRVLSTTTQVICNGNSGENIKYCAGKTVEVAVQKMGE